MLLMPFSQEDEKLQLKDRRDPNRQAGLHHSDRFTTSSRKDMHTANSVYCPPSLTCVLSVGLLLLCPLAPVPPCLPPHSCVGGLTLDRSHRQSSHLRYLRWQSTTNPTRSHRCRLAARSAHRRS